MELRGTDAAQSALLMPAPSPGGASAGPSDVDIRVEQTALRETLLALALGLLGVLLGAGLFFAFLREWFEEMSYRAWLLLAFLAPLSLVFQRIWALTWRHVERRRWLRVEMDSLLEDALPCGGRLHRIFCRVRLCDLQL